MLKVFLSIFFLRKAGKRLNCKSIICEGIKVLDIRIGLKISLFIFLLVDWTGLVVAVAPADGLLY